MQVFNLMCCVLAVKWRLAHDMSKRRSPMGFILSIIHALIEVGDLDQGPRNLLNNGDDLLLKVLRLCVAGLQ